MGLIMLIFISTMHSTHLLASSAQPAAKRASQRCCWIMTLRPSNFHLEIYQKSGSTSTHCKGTEEIPMRLSVVVEDCSHPIWFVHLQTNKLHTHSCYFPYACSQGKGAYMPIKNISSDAIGDKDTFHMSGLHITLGPPMHQEWGNPYMILH